MHDSFKIFFILSGFSSCFTILTRLFYLFSYYSLRRFFAATFKKWKYFCKFLSFESKKENRVKELFGFRFLCGNLSLSDLTISNWSRKCFLVCFYLCIVFQKEERRNENIANCAVLLTKLEYIGYFFGRITGESWLLAWVKCVKFHEIFSFINSLLWNIDIFYVFQILTGFKSLKFRTKMWQLQNFFFLS